MVVADIPTFFVSQKVCMKTSHGHYIRAGFFHGVNLQSSPHSWETFTAHRLDDGCITFKTWNGSFLSASPPAGEEGSVKMKQRRTLGEREKFRVVPVGVMYAIQSCYGTYVSAHPTSGRVDLRAGVQDDEMFHILAV